MKRRAIPTAALWILVHLAPGAVGAQDRPDSTATAPTHVTGCYDVTLGTWRIKDVPRREGAPPLMPSEAPAADDSLVHVIPPRVQLSAEVDPASRFGQTVWSAAAPPGALPVGLRHQTWNMKGDSLHLVYFSGFAGMIGVLSPDGDGWIGPMEAETDVVGITRWERTVALDRVDCSSPPPITDESVWRLPRTVELEGGMAVTLGEAPTPEIPTFERSQRASGVAVPNAGLFAGADTTVVVVHDGRVGMVQMEWLPPADPADLVARLSAAYGEPDAIPPLRPPAHVGSFPPDPRPVAFYAWQGRITTLLVMPGIRGGFRVALSDPRYY